MGAERKIWRSGGFRLEAGGLLVERDKPVAFFLNGESLVGLQGDTLASALLAGGRALTPSSPRYGRPRALYTAGAEEPNAVFDIEVRRGREAGRPAPMVPLCTGLRAFAAGIPILNASGIRGLAAPLLDRAAPKRPLAAVRPDAVAAAEGAEEELNFFTDVLVVGGGVAGIAAAKAAAASGARVLLVEQAAQFGGRALVDGGKIGRLHARSWIEKEIEALKAATEATLRLNSEALSIDDPEGALILERPAAPGPLRRLWRVRALRVVLATGAVERPLVFAENDLPGVMTASSMRDYLALYGVAAGRRVALFANNDDAYLTAIQLAEAGVAIAAIVDPREEIVGEAPKKAEAMGLPLRLGCVVARVLASPRAGGWIEGVEIAALRASGRLGAVETIACDALAVSGGWSPALRLWREAGGAVVWDDKALQFQPDPSAGGFKFDIADAAGGVAAAVAAGLAAGKQAAKEAGFTPARLAAPKTEKLEEGPPHPLWVAPSAPEFADGERHFIDLASDLTVEEVERAARGGAASAEALCAAVGLPAPLGALSETQALALIADLRKTPIGEVAGAGQGPCARPRRAPAFEAERFSPLQSWHEAHGAVFTQEGDWRAPLCFLRQSGPDGEMEDEEEASIREIRLARRGVGAYDASHLAKLLIRGEDASRALEAAFARPIAPLDVGRCAVGLAVDESGTPLSEAVVARLDEAGYLIHAPAAVGEIVARRLEEAAGGRSAYVADLTDVWAQIILVGPSSRALLERLTEQDLSDEALATLAWIEVRLAGCEARLFRHSQAGGMGYEIAVPASLALSFWRRLFEAGETLGLQPIGEAARETLRIERGRPAPADLANAATPDRWSLVGLEPEDSDLPLPRGGAVFAGEGGGALLRLFGASEAPAGPIGRVTSSCWSPTLGRAIALARLEGGTGRLGETAHLRDEEGRLLRAQVVEPPFVKPEDQHLDGWRAH